jgi:DNA-binding response OmpR family regulator
MKTTFFIIDRNKERGEKLAVLLKQRGLFSYVAHTYSNTITWVTGNEPKYILLDHKFPGEDILIKHIRRFAPHAPIVILTDTDSEVLEIRTKALLAKKAVSRESLNKSSSLVNENNFLDFCK